MINVVNKSIRVSDADVKAMVRACAHQLRYDAAPIWGRVPIPVIYLPSESHAQPGSWVIAVLDDADAADALGWHSENQGEVIYGRVFASPVLDNGGDALHKTLSVASVLSHEILEIFIDPSCNLYADDGAGTAVAVEIADPVEDGVYPIAVPGHGPIPVLGHGQITVSNFVTPAWFDPQAKPGDRFDFSGVLRKPFEITHGGYVVEMKEGRVTQRFGRHYPEWRRATKEYELARTAKRTKAQEA